MHCPRCNGPMMIMKRQVQSQSTQTWYQCTTCSGRRLLSADRPCYFVGSGQPLTSRFRADTQNVSDLLPEPFQQRIA
jgi:DNA-directed RNA polymerase subunit RPC12/RpoP